MMSRHCFLATVLITLTGGALPAWHGVERPVPVRIAADTTSPYQFFVGRWSCAGGTPAGRALGADVSFAPLLEGRFIQMHHLDRPPGRYESLALWPVAASSFETTVHDNFGGMRRFAGTVSTSGGVVLQRDTLEKGARLESFTYTPLSDSTYLYAWHVRRAPGQPLVLGDSAICQRLR